MNIVLRASLGASLLLNGLLAWILIRQPAPVTVAAPAAAKKQDVVHAAPPPAAPFQWKQIEAADFATYIANLRLAGCPEATIRSIIAPEVAQVVATRQREAGSPSDPAAAGMQAAEWTESLLAAPAASAQPVADTAPTAPQSPSIRSAISITPGVPAAFAVGNAPDDPVTSASLSTIPSDPTLPPETRQTISTLREKFGQAVLSSSSSTDPSSREYHLQWLKAQRASDDTFSSMFGGDTFIRVQKEAAAREAAQNAPSPVK